VQSPDPPPRPSRERDLAAQLAGVLAVVDTGVVVVDVEGKITLFNETFAVLSRRVLLRDPARGLLLTELIAPGVRPRLHDYWKRFVDRTLEGQTLFADGTVPLGDSVGAFELRSVPLLEAGLPAGAAISIRDTTTQKRRASHELVEIVLARTFSEGGEPGVALTKALETLCTASGSPSAVVMFRDRSDGPLEPLASWSEHAEFPKEKPSEYRRSREAVSIPVRSGDEVIAVIEFAAAERISGGAVDPVELFDTVGYAVERYLLALRNERERAALQGAIERKGREWASTFDAIETPLLIMDESGVIRRMNRSTVTLVGDPYDSLVGRPVRDLPSDGPWSFLADAVDAVRDSGQGLTAQLEDASGRHWDIVASEASDGDENRVAVVMRDVTSVIELRESVRRGEQLAAMGELVAGVAHEVRNPLFGISASLDALELVVSDDDDARELFGALRVWIVRLNALMVQLLEYGKTWSVDLSPGDIAEVIRSSATLCQASADERGIALHVDLEPELPPILMDSTRLTQVFSNLIMNSFSYARKNIWITAKWRKVGTVAMIDCSVRDDGTGFAPDDMARVFQPFFTRRRSGTGLGLSIVQRIVDEHGGMVSASNHASGGAVVSMTFPAIPPRA
jgi:signal transduction histidine kinase